MHLIFHKPEINFFLMHLIAFELPNHLISFNCPAINNQTGFSTDRHVPNIVCILRNPSTRSGKRIPLTLEGDRTAQPATSGPER